MSLSQVWEQLVERETARPQGPSRLKAFTDRYPWLGWLIFLLAVVYFVVQVVVAAVFRPSYSWANNVISDLGNTSCSAGLCSPRHAAMNFGFIELGVVMALGSLFINQEFAERSADQRLAARIGFTMLAIAGAGTIVVGCVPENTVDLLHQIGAGVAIGIGTAGILLLGIILVLPRGLAWGMRAVPPIALVALVLFALHVYLGLGRGGMERAAAYPEAVWLIVFGIYIGADHVKQRISALEAAA